MKRVLLLLLPLILLTSLISADILITQEPDSSYNLGDVVNVPLKITTLNGINGFLTVSIICSGTEAEAHKEYILLGIGEESESIIKIPLIQGFVTREAKSCVVKATLGTKSTLTKEFEVSSVINLEIKNQSSDLSPGEKIIIEGLAKKGNGANAKGFIDASIVKNGGEELKISNTILNGYFKLESEVSENFPAGVYTALLTAYEKDSDGQITNQGTATTTFTIKQIPKNLEIAFENSKIEPGIAIKVRAILHDQTGEKIDSTANLKITDETGKIITEAEIATNEFYEYATKYNQKPVNWKIKGTSENVEGEGYLEIIPLAKVEVTLINKTISIKNVGNVVYNKTVQVKIGDQTISIPTNLDIDQEEKYALSAPNGEYEVEVMGQTQRVMLTGNAIDIKKIGGISTIIQYPLVWMFIIGILGFVSYLFFKKGYNQTFIGYITRKKKGNITKNEEPLRKNSLVQSHNRAEVSLSIKGLKQGISLVCLKIKNLKDIEKKKGDIEATIQQIVDTAEGSKALTYENQDNIFFLFVPLKTKTFRNEKTAIQTAQNIKRIIDQANKLFKDKINYGISLNSGTIVVKQESDSFKFMSLGTLMSEARRISSESNGEVLLSEDIKNKTATDTKTEKVPNTKTPMYKLKELKLESEDNKKFISSFIKRLEKK